MHTPRKVASGLFLILTVAMPLTAMSAGADTVPQMLPQVSLPAYGSQQSVLTGPAAGSCTSSDPTSVACAIPSSHRLKVLCLTPAFVQTITVFARSQSTEVIATQVVSCSDPAGYTMSLRPSESALMTVTQALARSCTTTNPSVVLCTVLSSHKVAVYCLSGDPPFEAFASVSAPYVRFAGVIALVDVTCADRQGAGHPEEEQLVNTTSVYRLYDGGTPFKASSCKWAAAGDSVSGSCRPWGHGIKVTCGSVADMFAGAFVTGDRPPVMKGVVTLFSVGCVAPMP
jgi:hypothetical protein